MVFAPLVAQELRLIAMSNWTLTRAAGLVAALCASTVPASGQRPALAMLDQLDHGMWELRPRDGRNAVERLCVTSGRRLIQLRHSESACERFVVDDQPGQVTVQYTCRGRGYGRTHIRRESNRLVQIDSQGIAEGLPFDFTAEARRVGDCSS
jgi:hypothetical protein